MATLIETPTLEVQERPPIGRPVVAQPGQALSPTVHREYRVLFSDSLLDSPEKKRRTWTTMLSFSFQCVVIGMLVIMPLWFTEALPKAQLLTFLVAPPPPPPPPPPAAQVPIKVIRQTDVLNNGQLRTPTRIPQKIEMIKEEEAPPPAAAGVVGGVPGGIPGGQLNGVIGGIVRSSNAAASLVAPMPKHIRVSQGVILGQLIHRVEPVYPRIARGARVQGAVQLKAIISKNGDITELEVVSGHPILIPAALEAVKQWRYRPYLLNGEAVEVETSITVNFTIAE
jgi:periplasmic protein TonB